jgi:hypothetical protein
MARKRNPKAPVQIVESARGGFVKESSMRVLHENHGEVEIVSPVRIQRSMRSSILETPPPYRKEWLDENGLEVHYAHGRAVLRFKA